MISPGNRTAPYLAAFGGSADIIKILVAHGADPRMPDDVEGFSPLHMACQENHKEAVVALIECKAEVNFGAAGRGNVTPLHTAAVEGNAEIIEVLLSKKAKYESKDANGETPLFAAARSNCAEAVRCLAKNKVSPICHP